MRPIVAAIGGAAIGAGAALLFAPQSGRATRAAIRDKATKYSTDVQDFAKGKSEHLRNKMEGAKHQIQGAMSKGRELINRGEDRAAGTSSNTIEQPTQETGAPYAGSTV